jgi:polysaccharide pyruvyl transferase WcaK-like protein
MRVLLVGYYGQGNFGDDVLFVTAYNRVRAWRPDAEITALVHGPDAAYLHGLVQGPLRLTAPGERGAYDLAVHGGGGTFFDFSQGSNRDVWINRVIRAVGVPAWARADRAARRVAGRPRTGASRRWGWGIGIGTYTASAPKLRHHAPVLADFETLVVRDPKSVENARAVGVGDRVRLGSDLAFLHDCWAPAELRSRARSGSFRIGVVPRGWKGAEGAAVVDALVDSARSLPADLDVRWFLFDAHDDAAVRARLGDADVRVWNPAGGLDAYSAALADVDVLVTARAHGAICGAILGVPSLIAPIEPKLSTIHAMLPAASRMLPASFDGPALAEAARAQAEVTAVDVAADVARNRAAISTHVDALTRAWDGP